MPRVVAEYKAQARMRITEAAQVVFRRKGFRAATMEDIAREIGVSKGAIYLYFRTKSELLAAIQEQSRDQVLAHWERLLQSGDVAEGIADSLAEVYAGKVDPGIWLELVAEAAANPQVRTALKEDHRQDITAMRDFLKRLEQRGRIRKLREPETVASITLALLHGSVLEMVLHGQAQESRRNLIRSLRFLLDPER
jgi:AcrR family transcriptional regulator